MVAGGEGGVLLFFLGHRSRLSHYFTDALNVGGGGHYCRSLSLTVTTLHPDNDSEGEGGILHC